MSLSRALTASFALALLAVLSGAQGRVNLLLDGSFELPSVGNGSSKTYTEIVGWKTSNDRLRVHDGDDEMAPAHIEQFAELEDEVEVYQDVRTAVGTSYVLRFAARPHPDADGTTEFEVWFEDQLVDTVTLLPSPSEDRWRYFTYTVVSTQTTSRLEFRDLTDDNDGSLLDNVSLSGLERDSGIHLRSWTKLSDTLGGATPSLANLDMFGRAVANVGDLDGDGVSELAVGAPGDDDGGAVGDDLGAVWILFLQPDGTSKLATKISMLQGGFTGPLEPGDGFGRAVAGLGDFNGDGVPDLLVGANGDDDGGDERGAFYLLMLDRDGTVKTEHKISDTAGNFGGGLHDHDEFGRALAALGDLDGDGITDLAVGATNDDEGGTNNGAFYVLFMNLDATVRSHQKITEYVGGFQRTLSRNEYFAAALSPLGDHDGDGVEDVLVGSLWHTGYLNSYCGSAWVLFLNTDGTVRDYTLIDDNDGGLRTGALHINDQFGGSLSALGDIDGDGVGDIVVGEIKDDDDGRGRRFTERGAAWVLLLNADGTVKEQQKFSDVFGGFDATFNDQDRFGQSVVGLGDLNGDNTPDLAVGARFDDDGGGNRGAVYLMMLDAGIPRPTRADFSASPTLGAAPLTVAFSDRSDGTVSSWSWDFGDGSTSTDANPSHVYTADGTFDVTLTVTDGTGTTDTHTSVGHVVVDSAATSVVRIGCGVNPVGSLTVQNGAPTIGGSVIFGIDDPTGSKSAGARTMLFLANAPDAAFPCGTLTPGFGMGGSDGAFLIDRRPPNPIRRIPGGIWKGPGQPGLARFDVPNNPNLIGFNLYAQGLVIDSSGGSLSLGLTDGLHLVIQ